MKLQFLRSDLKLKGIKIEINIAFQLFDIVKGVFYFFDIIHHTF